VKGHESPKANNKSESPRETKAKPKAPQAGKRRHAGCPNRI
jgi:hypothetical protein